MTDRLITHLRHVDLAVPDHARQLEFFTNTWGLKAEHSDSGLTFLAAEGSPEPYVVRLRKAADKRIDLIAFGAASRRRRHPGRAARRRRGAVGQRAGDLQTPGGGYGFRFFDNEGRTVEFHRRRRPGRTARSRRASTSPSGSPTSSSTPPTPRPRARSTRSTWPSRCPTP